MCSALAHGADEVELVLNLGWRRVPAPLVVLGHLIAKGASGQVEGDGQSAGILRAHEGHQHRRKPVQRVRDDPGRGLNVGRQGEEGPKGQGHAV